MSATILWDQLEQRLHTQIAAIPGAVGLCVHDLTDGAGFHINGDELFPTASTIKLHILTQLYLQAEQGRLDLAQSVISTDWHTGGSGVLAYLDDAPPLSLRDVANLMIVASDNSATNLCIDRVGLHAVNAMLKDLGLTHTRLRRKMMDAQAGRADIENVATPLELVRMLRLLYHGLPTEDVARQVLTVLRKPKQSFISQALPPGSAVANKAGWSTAVRSDAGIVFLPRRPYALAVMLNYGMGAPEALDGAVIGLVRAIHTTLAHLTECNTLGHAVFA